MALALLLVSQGTALGQSITGSWKATLGQAQLVLTFQSAGSAYKGTFVTSTAFVDAKGKKHTTTTTQQLTAVSKVTNSQQTLTVTIKAPKGALIKQAAMITCNLEKAGLSCFSPVTKAYVMFTPVKH